MPFIMMQQVHPAFIMALQQSQQAWIMAQHSASPLVQVMQTPLSVISHLHMAIVMLQQQAIIPFIMQQQEHIPPAIMVQRFWIMAAEAASSQTQDVFMPPLHFSILMVQRGTIIMFDPAGMVEGVPIDAALVPLMPIMVARSIIIALAIVSASLLAELRAILPGPTSTAEPTLTAIIADTNAICKDFSLKYASSR
jgi:hypothetical protein